MNDKIEILAAEKDFSRLDAAEKSLVLSEMSEADYERLHRIIAGAYQLDAQAAPPPLLKQQLLARPEWQHPLRRWLHTPVPLWQVAAAVSVGWLMWWIFPRETVETRIITDVQVRVDTVYKTIPVWHEMVLRISSDTPKIEAPAPDSTQTPPLAKSYTPEADTPGRGTSLGDAPELMDFFTEGNK